MPQDFGKVSDPTGDVERMEPGSLPVKEEIGKLTLWPGRGTGVSH